MFYDIIIAFCGGVFALCFYNISDFLWEKILSKFISKGNKSHNSLKIKDVLDSRHSFIILCDWNGAEKLIFVNKDTYFAERTS